MSFLLRLARLWLEDSSALIVAGRVFVVGFGLLSAPIIARAIGPEGRGETATAAALAYIIPIALGLGIPLEVRRQLSIDSQTRILCAARVYAAVLTPVAAGLGVAAYFSIFASFETGARLTASVLICLTPLTVSWMCDASAFLAEGRFRAFFGLQLVQPGAYLAGVVILWSLGLATTATVLLMSGAATVLSFLYGLLTSCRRHRDGGRTTLAVLLRGGIRYAGAGIAEALSNRLDQVLALPILGAVQAGYYSVAVTIGTAPLALAHALGARYFPSAASAAARGEDTELARTKIRAVRSGLVMGTFSVGVLAALTPLVVPIVFGSEFQPAVVPTLVLLAGSIFMVASFVASILLAAEGKGLSMSISQVGSMVVGVGLLVWLGPTMGATGASVAAGITFFALFVALIAFLRLPMTTWRIGPRDFRHAFSDLFSGTKAGDL